MSSKQQHVREKQWSPIILDYHFLPQAGPRVSFDSCSLQASDRGVDLTLQWSQNYTTQHNVGEYVVTVDPDLSSCNRNITPNRNYTCPGLSLGRPYTFKFDAQYLSLCEDRSLRPDKTRFTVQLNGEAISYSGTSCWVAFFKQGVLLRNLILKRWMEWFNGDKYVFHHSASTVAIMLS